MPDHSSLKSKKIDGKNTAIDTSASEKISHEKRSTETLTSGALKSDSLNSSAVNLKTSSSVTTYSDDTISHNINATQPLQEDCENSKSADNFSAEFYPPVTVKTPWYYQVLIKIAKPIYRLALWNRYKKAKKTNIETADYKYEIATRFAHQYPQPPALPMNLEADENSVFYNCMVWCHAVSLGETNTIAPMLKVMLARGAKLWLTNTTQTGFARAELIFAEEIASGQLVHSFVPVDDKQVIRQFVNHLQPNLVMFVETELWANTLQILSEHSIPSVLVNARLSQKSFLQYQKYAALSKSMMSNISMIIAQDGESAKRFRYLGADVPKIRRANSLKWSSDKFKKQNNESNLTNVKNNFFAENASPNRPTWVAGSTHDGEEQIALNVQQQLLTKSGLQACLLIVVPRHPERFDEVAAIIEKFGLSYARRSKGDKITDSTQVYLVDTMGELDMCYQIADVAFVGGSLVDIGGHNPIEAVNYSKPIIMGQYTQSCQEMVDALQAVTALKVVTSATNNQHDTQLTGQNMATTDEQLLAILYEWLSQPKLAQQAGQQGKKLLADKKSALDNQLTMIESLLKKYSASMR